MTIRAVLARPRGEYPNQFEGVYLHNAGMPSELGATLFHLMRERYRFDAASFSREMIDGNLAGWSNIQCLGGELAKTWDGKTKLTVAQHQENFNNDIEDAGPTSFSGDAQREIPGITQPPIDDTSDNWGADCVYVVAQDELRILIVSGGHYEVVSTFPWTEEPDWDDVDEQLQDASDQAVESNNGAAIADADECYDAYDALETAESHKAVAASAKLLNAGKVAEGQKLLLAFLETHPMSPNVLANLYYTLGRVNIAPARLTKLFDDTIENMTATPELITPDCLGNMMVVLNNHGRGADSVRLFELAYANKKWPHGPCYIGMSYGAYHSGDKVLMQRAIEHVERGLAKKPHVLQDPILFDNMASLHAALGNKAAALDAIRMCKKLNYPAFANMPNDPALAPIKDDPEFKALFAR